MNEKKKFTYSTKSLVAFCIITGGLSAIWETVIICTGFMGLTVILMWVPAFGALIASFLAGKNADGSRNMSVHGMMGFRKTSIKNILKAVAIPFVYLLIPYLIYWIIMPGNFKVPEDTNWISIVIIAMLGVFGSLLTALGEEIGWRGFFFPALMERIGMRKAAFLVGFIWALWHFPILISGMYMAGTPLVYQMVAFMLTILPVAIIMGIATAESKSVWPAAFMHASHNHFDQALFGPFTIGDNKMYFVSETGVFTILCAWTIAIFFLIKYSKKSQ